MNLVNVDLSRELVSKKVEAEVVNRRPLDIHTSPSR